MTNRPTILIAATVPIHLRAFHLPWVNRLRERGCTVIGIAENISAMEECVSAFSEVYDVPFSRNPLQLGSAAAASSTVKNLLKSKKVDLVHVHTPVAAFVTRKAAQPFRRTGLRTVYTAHGFHFHDRGKSYRNIIFQILEKYAGRWTDYLIVHNRSDENDARRLRIVPDDRLLYHPGVGIDLDSFAPQRISADAIRANRDQLKLKASDRLITMVSEFIPRKRHADVIRALSELKRPDIHLALVGEGALEAEIRALVKEHNLDHVVHFVGYRRDVPTWIRAADCTILASAHEGLPRSVMESLCLEVPVIGSDVRGTRDLISGGGGVTYPVGDVSRLAATILKVVDQPTYARELGKAGRRSMQPYGLANILNLHDELYLRALGDRFQVSAGKC